MSVKIKLFLVLFFLSFNSLAVTSQKELENTAKNWVTQQLINSPEKYTLSFVNPNQNLNYKKCTSPIEINIMGDKPLQGRLNLKLSCLTEDWFTYLGIHLETFTQVVVAKTHLGRGSQLNPNLLEVKELVTTNLKNDYYTNLNDLTGKKLKTAVRAGGVITSNLIELSALVNKGEIVNLSSSQGRLKVQIKVEAVNSGKLGQRINVKNLQTGKQLRALVIGPGEVEAL